MGVNIIETNLQFKQPLKKREQTDYLVLHHAEASNASVEDIHRWHLENGWAGIGYHYYVRKDGSIYRGRPRDTIGAHVQGHNYDSLGICAEGDYMKEIMPEAQKQSIIELLKELVQIYPNAKIVGHRDLMATSCPGINYPFREIVQKVYQKEVIPMVGPFQDVPENHWAAQAILDLYNRGLLAKNNTFRPDQPITRAEVVALLDRVLKYLGK